MGKQRISSVGLTRCEAGLPIGALLLLLLVIAAPVRSDVLAGTASPPTSAAPRALLAPDPFVAAVAAVRPSVLAIGSYYFKDTPSAQYAGTGFVIDDGHIIVTNAHVVETIREQKRLAYLTVFQPDTRPKQGRRAVLLGEDSVHDVAILRISEPALPALKLDTTTVPPQGQAIGVIGYPLGMRLGVVPAVHKGVVAAVVAAVRPLPGGATLTPQLARAIRQPYRFYQLDVVAYPGNSGSPMFDARTGRVLGIINKALANKTREHLARHPSGIAYAVETRWIHQLLVRSRSRTRASRDTAVR